jgi:signal transduction histidine kinase
VCVTAKGDLWVGSGAGAGIFDFKQKQYNPQGSASGLANGSVREIDEDPDGSLWFSCDQWPDASAKPGGLTRLKNGQWQTFSRSNGLPMDYVIGYFRDSTGRRFAMTPHGWTQEQDGRWGPPLNPGWEAEDCVLQMAEAGDGTLFAQGEHGLLVLKDGRWQSVEDNITRVVCATRDGQMAAVEYNGARGRLWFSLWDGNRFVRASAPVACQSGARFYHLREAPDGSLWCVGFGTVVRWAYRSGQWAAYPQLPPPVGTDKLGRVWFAGESNVVVCAGGQFKMLPPGKLAAWSPAGLAMVRDAQAQQLMVTDVKDPAIRTPVEAGCESVTSIKADGENGFWFCGEDGSGNGVVAHYRDGKTSVIAPPEFQGRQLMSPVPGPPDKLWVVAHYRDDVRYDLALVSGDRVEWQPLRPAPPTLTYPNWSAGAGQHWLSGYASLYQQTNPPAGDWQQVTAFPDTGFGGRLTSSNEALFAFSGGQSGRPGCGLFSRNGWRMAAGDFYQPTFGPDGETIYLSSRGGVFIRKEPGTLDLEYLPIPGDAFVGITVADTAGNLWLGTSDGVLRYQPARTPPDTKIVASATEVSKGSPLPVTFHGRSRFERENRPASFHYAWRIDGGPWSGFQPLPENGFLLPDLNPGRHRLEVRARDVDGNVDPTPAVLSFNVLPLPLQQRGWFIPLVVLLAAVLLRLTWLRLAHVRQMAATNAALRRENDIRRQTEAELEQARRELEIRVVERTAELSRANESLNREIAERKLAEESQRRLEAQLHQSQKMEAIGTLAGGIAHDFNNILAVIIPYCHLALEDVKDRPDLQENLTAVLRAADRAKHLVQQILTFSRRQYQACQVVNLEPVVAETLKLLRSALPSTIQMVQHSQPTPPVLVDTTQIHQVIMNLCINAQHAMEGRQGRLEVGLDAVLVDEALRARSADLQCGRYVRLTIRDNGCGIPPEILGRSSPPRRPVAAPAWGWPWCMAL